MAFGGNFYAIVKLAARAKNQHRRAGTPPANALKHLQAVHIGQHEVENHQVVIGGVRMLQRHAAGSRRVHRVARALKAAAQKVGDTFFVLDDQNSHCS